MADKGILIVVSGFSGAGKGTLVKKLLETYDNYALSVSMTTRAPRAGEQEGVHYFFTDREHFEDRISCNGFIEYAQYCGNYYGTPKAFVEEQLARGRDVILEIEVQGALKVREQFPDSLLLFVTPPDAVELERRLRSRKTEDTAAIAGRMARASEEAEDMGAYDYIVVNDDLDACVQEIHRLVAAARSAPVRRQEFINKIKEELTGFAKGAQK